MKKFLLILMAFVSFCFFFSCSKDSKSSSSQTSKVAILVNGVEINSLSLDSGEQLTLEAQLRDKNNTYIESSNVVWHISDNAGVFDDDTKRVTNFTVATGLTSSGNFIITVDCDGIKKSIKLTVAYKAFYELKISGQNILSSGATSQYTATLYKDYNLVTEQKGVNWSLLPSDSAEFVGGISANYSQTGEPITLKIKDSFSGNFTLNATCIHKDGELVITVAS